MLLADNTLMYEDNKPESREKQMDKEVYMQGKVRAVCISPSKGTEKRPVKVGHFVKDFGIEHDAHAGKWHRQVSLLSYDCVPEFKSL